jgi:hypothetical protein
MSTRKEQRIVAAITKIIQQITWLRNIQLYFE